LEWNPMADSDSDRVNQDEIEALLRATRGEDAESSAASEAVADAEPKREAASTTASPPSSEAVSGDDIELLLRQAEDALASAEVPVDPLLEGLSPYDLKSFRGTPPSDERASLELLRDVELDLKIELGRTQMNLEDVLRLRKGAVVPLEKLAGDPVDIIVNGRLVAKGEVLVLNDNFCVRVAELVSGDLRP
jgi:flagellar motor switch protein FliN/FliY